MLKRLNMLIWSIIITIFLIATLTYLIHAQIIENDFGKTFSGTFIGAWLAFISNMFMRHQNQYREDLAAGRRALFTLKNQLEDFLNFRRAFQHVTAQIDVGIPGAPEWALAKPMGFNFNSSNVFDYKSLDFLLSKPSGIEAYQQLQFIERTYLDLIAWHSDLNNGTLELQNKMGELQQKIENIQEMSLVSLEPHLGLDFYRVRDFLRGVALRVDQDEPLYIHTHNILITALKEILGNQAAMPLLQVPDELKKENLPPLPKLIRSYLDQQTVQKN